MDKAVVVEGREARHFLIAAGGTLIVTMPSPPNAEGSGARLFEARESMAQKPGAVEHRGGSGGGGGSPVGKVIEVECTASSLCSAACFVLLPRDSTKQAYVWIGDAACDGDAKLAQAALERLGRRGGIIRQGSEHDSFWHEIGGRGSAGVGGRGWGGGGLRILHVEMAGSTCRPREVALPNQADLDESPSGACIVDDCAGARGSGRVYLWVDPITCGGSRLEVAMVLAKKYCAARGARLRSIGVQTGDDSISVQRSGEESAAFTSLFLAWRRKTASCSNVKELADGLEPSTAPARGHGVASTPFSESAGGQQQQQQQQGASVVRGNILPLKELQHVPRDRLPPGVDASCREAHISDADFEAVFKCSRETFGGMPGWKKTVLRKDAGLF